VHQRLLKLLDDNTGREKAKVKVKQQTQPQEKKCIPPSDNIHTVPQQDFRITFKYFNYCILGLTHHKYILTVTGYNNQKWTKKKYVINISAPMILKTGR